ncbi:MAG: VWA domain-containing protein [Deltaproteobacteria bacterium]|nr:VWA domain-containing protein [Deltaproteobacteria bacterium]
MNGIALGRVRLAGWAAVLGLALAGCAGDAAPATSASEGGSGTYASKDTSSDASTGKTNGSGATDAGTTTGGGGIQTPGAGNADMGIGLKPGGAQDIAFFRQKLASAMLPKPGDMTIEGWLNEHDTVLPPAKKDRAVTLHAMAGVMAEPGAQPSAVLQIGLNSGKTLADVQTTLSLTVVIDRSGSMAGDKLAFVKAGLHALAEQLPKGTRLGLVSFSSTVTVPFAPAVIDASNVQALHDAIDALVADGGTNIFQALGEGSALCQATPVGFEQKRILFLSDGLPTVGTTGFDSILGQVTEAKAGGCSVSSVGVGLDFSPSLMNAIAQKGNGTAWFLPNAQAAKEVFVQDLETMLLPVAEKLTLQFKLANGWKVAEIYGFKWVEKDGEVTITGPMEAVGPTDPGNPDPGNPEDPEVGTDPVAMPTLFASKRNGLVMARLIAPANTQPADLANLTLATVTYGYTLSKGGAAEQFSVPVQVPGLVQIPDGGLAYFANPAVHRAWLLLGDGLSLIQAVAQAEAGLTADAQATLAVQKQLHDKHMALLAADLPVYDASVPNLGDAADLLAALAKVISK